MKKSATLFLITGSVILLTSFSGSSQALTRFFGFNGWLSNTHLGSGNGFESTLGNNHLNNAGSANSINGKMVRYGGVKYDEAFMTATELSNFTNALALSKNAGLEPILQIPVAAGILDYFAAHPINSFPNLTVGQALTDLLTNGWGTYTTDVKTFVQTFAADITYWSIGNEPDNWAAEYGNLDARFSNSATKVTAADIAFYIKYFAENIRIWDTGPTLPEQILGPDLAWDNFTGGNLFKDLSGAVAGDDIWTPTTVIKGDNVDIFTFHEYSMGAPNSSFPNGSPWTRQNVIDKPYVGTATFNSKLTNIQNWLASNNGYGYSKLGITEFNICYKNNPDGDANETPSTDNPINGVAANSFLAGQFFAEMLAWALSSAVVVGFCHDVTLECTRRYSASRVERFRYV